MYGSQTSIHSSFGHPSLHTSLLLSLCLSVLPSSWWIVCWLVNCPCVRICIRRMVSVGLSVPPMICCPSSVRPISASWWLARLWGNNICYVACWEHIWLPVVEAGWLAALLPVVLSVGRVSIYAKTVAVVDFFSLLGKWNLQLVVPDRFAKTSPSTGHSCLNQHLVGGNRCHYRWPTPTKDRRQPANNCQ